MARPHGGLNPRVVEAVSSVVDGAGVVVALGGGADSAVLLAGAKEAGPRSLRALFVDHALAGSDSLRTAASDLALQLDVPLTILQGPVEDGPDLEARARAIRYTTMEHDLSDDEIALTGHTRDDQAETLVMRLAAGSGATGLAGIPERRGPWRRPLLSFSRSELRALAEESRLPFTDDPANADDRFLRNRIRGEVIPGLERAMGRGVREGIARSAALLRSDDEALRAAADAIPVMTRSGSVVIAVSPLVTAHPAVAARACRGALRILLDGTSGSSRDVTAILTAATTGTTGQLTHGHLATRQGPFVVIGPAPRPGERFDVGPGERFDWVGDAYEVRVEPVRPPVLEGGRFTLLDPGAVGTTMTMRGVEAGDTLDIGVGSTPVTELLRVHGVAPQDRPISLVATVDAKIAAVVGVRSAAWAKARAGAPCLVIERVEDT